MMILYSQRNPLWALVELGRSKLKMGRFGCVVTCIAMLGSYYKESVLGGLPENPNYYLKVCKFTDGGLLYWSSCKFKKFYFVKRLRHYDDSAIKKSLLSSPNTSVLVEVDYSHWVVIIGLDNWGRYRIADPWFGDRAKITRYGEITGSAHFNRT